MSATRMKDLPPRLQDRYGYRRTPIVAIVIAAVLALLIAGLGGWMAYRVANPEVRYRLLAWDAVSPDHTSITFEVNKGASASVDCVLRVQNKAHQDLGFLDAVACWRRRAAGLFGGADGGQRRIEPAVEVWAHGELGVGFGQFGVAGDGFRVQRLHFVHKARGGVLVPVLEHRVVDIPHQREPGVEQPQHVADVAAVLQR